MKSTRLRIIGLFLFCALSFVGCKDDSDEVFEKQKIMDEELIQAYLTDNKLTSQKLASGLHHLVVEEGTGTAFPNINSMVEVKYRGRLLNDRVFDQTDDDKSIEFGLSQVIVGWQEGLQLMKKGGKSILIIPSHLGYGARDLSGIPANSVLIFDIELVNF